jgi:biotin carboxyl carrier protein
MRWAGTAVVILALANATQTAPSIHVEARARSVQPGELVVLTMTTSGEASAVRVRAFDRDLSPYRSGAREWQALVGIDLDASISTHRVSIEADIDGRTERTGYDLAVQPKRFPTRSLQVDEAFVNPPAAVTDRIAREARALAALWAAPSPERLWTGPFIRPVPQSTNSAFGTRSVFNGQPRSPHSGADFLSPAGTPVKAPNSGRIVLARDLYYTGNSVVIDHGLGLFSFFAHLSTIDVHEGDQVRTGDVLGLVGATGRVTGPHLHWTLRASGARVDPLSLLALLGESAER